MRILVTGHNGYIGSVMTWVLQNAGHDVVGVDSYLFEGCSLGDESPETLPALRKDIRDLSLAELAGFDAVVHLAALCNDPLGDLNREWTDDINYQASVRLAKTARDAGVSRFLYSSSCSMYGAAGDELVTEDAPLAPLTPYAESKVRTEEHVSRLADSHFCPVFLRNATAYGVSPRLRADVVLNNLVGWAYTTGKVRIMSDGSPWRPIVHVEDIALAFAAILVAPREVVHNQAFNVGINGENYQVRELAAIVAKTVPGCTIEFANQGGPDLRNYRVNFAKLERLVPQFRPRWNAAKGAAQLYRAYKDAGMTPDDFLGRRHVRLLQLKYLLETGRVDSSLRPEWLQ
jgi:nucleoside-diphosphate-sugar epimerase